MENEPKGLFAHTVGRNPNNGLPLRPPVFDTNNPPLEGVATVMLRYNTNKPPLTMVPTAFIEILGVGKHTYLLEDTARVLDFGSRKYARDNWRKGGEWMQVLDCAFRHLNKIMRGETHDDETGIHHAAHVACNLAFLAEFIEQKKGTDNRYIVKRPAKSVKPKDLELIYGLLLEWKDGANNYSFEAAVHELAVWYDRLPPTARSIKPGTSPHAAIPKDEKNA